MPKPIIMTQSGWIERFTRQQPDSFLWHVSFTTYNGNIAVWEMDEQNARETLRQIVEYLNGKVKNEGNLVRSLSG